MATIAEQLTNLEQLKAANLISEEEYKSKREQVLASFAGGAQNASATGTTVSLPMLEKSARGSQPVKSKRTALILEIVFGSFNLWGIGWLYASNVKTGLILLIAGLLWSLIGLALLVATAGASSIITLTIQIFIIAFSSYRLNKHAKSHPELFKN